MTSHDDPVRAQAATPAGEFCALALLGGRALERATPDVALLEAVGLLLRRALSQDPAARPTAAEVSQVLG